MVSAAVVVAMASWEIVPTVVVVVVSAAIAVSMLVIDDDIVVFAVPVTSLFMAASVAIVIVVIVLALMSIPDAVPSFALPAFFGVAPRCVSPVEVKSAGSVPICVVGTRAISDM